MVAIVWILNEDELHRMLNKDELWDAVLLVFSNKQNLPLAMSTAEVTDKLGMHGLCHRQQFIQVYRATMGGGCMKVCTGFRPLSRRDSW